MVSVARIIPAPSTRQEAVHYHAFLAAVSMSRFGQLSKLIAFVCYGMTVNLGSFSHIGWLWWILPFRAVVMFIAAFIVLVYRKSWLQVSNKPYANLFSKLCNKLCSKEFASAVVVYTISSHLFYLLVKGQYTFPLTVKSRPYEPPTLNEQYLYLNSFAVYIAVCYAIGFVVFDYEMVRFHTTPSKLNHNKRVRMAAKENVPATIVYSVAATLSYPIVYLFFRRTIWTTSLGLLRCFFTLNRSNDYVAYPASFKMIVITLYTSFMLFTLWECVNSCFYIYMSLGPSNRGSTISEKSDDPNGTLITGLQATVKEYTHTMAFQELCGISLNNPERRCSIFRDIERDPEPTIWKQICKESLKVINAVSKRMESREVAAAPEAKKRQNSPLPSKSVLSVKHDNIFASAPKEHATTPTKRLVENLQDKNAEQSVRAVNFVEKASELVQGQVKKYSTVIERVLATPVGYPFRCTLWRKTLEIVPNPGLVHCALMSLQQFVIHSTEEDDFGIVHRDANIILNDLHKLIALIEQFIANPPLHWTDVLAISGQEKPSVRRLTQLLEMATDTFEKIVDVYSSQLGQLDLTADVEKRAFEYLNTY